MENATKALILSAAVLIAIVLIGLGVKILSSSNDSSAQVRETGKQLNTITKSAGNSASNSISELESMIY